MSWSMPARRALNVTYAVLIEGQPPDTRGQIDDTLNPPPPPTPAERRAALMRRSLAFAAEHGGEVR